MRLIFIAIIAACIVSCGTSRTIPATNVVSFTDTTITLKDGRICKIKDTVGWRIIVDCRCLPPRY